MNGVRPKEKRRDYPWRRWNRRLLLGVVCLAVLIGLAVAGVQWRADSSLQKRMEAIRAKGEPVTPEELAARHPAPPKAEDAGESYGKAGESLREDITAKEYQARMRSLYDTRLQNHIGEELLQWMEAYLAGHTDALNALLDAADRPPARFNLDLSRGFEAPLPNLLELRGSAQLLQLEAFVAAEKGESERAARAVRAILAMDHTMRDAPLTIMQMIRLALRSMACESIRRTLPLAGYSDGQLLLLGRALAETDDPEAVSRAFIGERAMGLQAFERPEYMIPDLREADKWLPGAGSLASGVVRLSLAASGERERYLDIMTRLVEASRLPVPEAMEQVRQLERETLATARTLLPSMTDWIIPSFGRCILQLARSDAELRCAMAAVAVERHRLAQGAPPEAIQELVPAFLPALPEDPFDGEPLRYSNDNDGYTLYSIGMDREDNGGVPTDTNRGDDVVFRVGRGE